VGSLYTVAELLTIISITYFECVSVLLRMLSGMQMTSFMDRVICSSVACLAVPYYSTLIFKRSELREKYRA
jgi:hypothetical protein